MSSYLEYLRYQPALSMDPLWVGWPGGTVPEEERENIRARASSEFNSVPVFLTEQEIEKFYQGFCNKTIWPLFHYFPAYANYEEDQWNNYVEVNRSFCQALLEILGPDDTIWVHDYHLMLLPAMIREQVPLATIGFFLHIPFPNFEIFRLLPSRWRRKILDGLLGADLIGFHTNDYKQDFLRCVLRIMGHDSNIGEIVVGDRVVKAETFPMGIDFDKYHNGSRNEAVQQERVEIQKGLRGAKVVLSIDRLDYSKGIVNRLEAFQMFLEACPQWHGKVVLLLIVVPSRIDVERYELMKNRIEQLVGMINGRFGGPGWTPIIYMFKALTFSPLVAMYSASHIGLVTPLRDGMNLIAKEFVATRADKTGVLILSEMAGASKELLEAITINPNDRREIAEAIAEALEMPEEEQVRRNTIMQERLRQYDVVRWAADFMEELNCSIRDRNKYKAKALGPDDRAQYVEKYRASNSRLFLLDYDGTLVPFGVRPEEATPGQALLKILRNLAEDPKNEVVIVSGRRRDFLDQWFSKLPLSMVAEHGAWVKERSRDWRMMGKIVHDWKPRLKPLLESYGNRIAGSFIEEKDFALVWHYRGADLQPGRLAAQELKDHLLALTANMDLHVLQGNKTVEIRIAGITKATGSFPFLSRGFYDLITCIGDDETDEDLFAVLPEKACSIRVGHVSTCARHTIPNVKDVVQLLEEISLPRGFLSKGQEQLREKTAGLHRMERPIRHGRTYRPSGMS